MNSIELDFNLMENWQLNLLHSYSESRKAYASSWCGSTILSLWAVQIRTTPSEQAVTMSPFSRNLTSQTQPGCLMLWMQTPSANNLSKWKGKKNKLVKLQKHLWAKSPKKSQMVTISICWQHNDLLKRCIRKEKRVPKTHSDFGNSSVNPQQNYIDHLPEST